MHAELAHPRDVVQVTADDLRRARPAAGAWRRAPRRDGRHARPTSRRRARPRSGTRRGESFEIPLRSQSRLYLNVVVKTSKLVSGLLRARVLPFPTYPKGARCPVSSIACGCLWPDHLGLARGKYVPASLAEHGVRHCTGTWALGYDRGMTPETPGSYWNEGLPDFDACYEMSDIRPGWEPGTKVVVADLMRLGEPFDRLAAPRAAPRDRRLAGARLQPVRRAWSSRPTSSSPTATGGWRPSTRPAPTSTAPDRRSTRTVCSTRSGRPATARRSRSSRSTPSTTHRSSSSRFATATRCAPPTKGSSSRCWRARWPTAHGLLLTFMGKPLSDRGGSGLHFNISLRDEAGENVIFDADARRRRLGARQARRRRHARAPSVTGRAVCADR